MLCVLGASPPVDAALIQKAAGVPECVRNCTEDLMVAASNAFNFQSFMKATKTICAEYKKATACIKKSGCSDVEGVYDMVTKGLYSVCVEKYSMLGLVGPCLDQNANRVFKKCDTKCGLLSDLNALTNDKEVQQVADEGGNALVLLDHLGPTCKSFICYLSCSQKGLERSCPATGSAYVDAMVRPLEEVARYLQTAAKSLVKLVNKHVPKQCLPLMDVDYLSRLKYFGSLPDSRAVYEISLRTVAL
ncbi:unnamed protein product [Toxocara canis]|uniref:CPG4 domain-containing protein n=1 Tax=Toxocara canis TaxID=6265 RepID=A0A183TVD3_TOXCA|nr:unnamed protein product [Toxocara canis]